MQAGGEKSGWTEMGGVGLVGGNYECIKIKLIDQEITRSFSLY